MNKNLIYSIQNNLDISFCNSVINYFNEKHNLNLTFSSYIANNVINKNIRNSIYIQLINLMKLKIIIKLF